jgi:hypothetical protein
MGYLEAEREKIEEKKRKKENFYFILYRVC